MSEKVLPFPRRRLVPPLPGLRLRRPSVSELVPSRRSLLVAVAVLAAAAAGYALARETPMFSIDRIDVRGTSPALAAEVRQALAGNLSHSLLALDGASVLRKVRALPSVRDVSYDRSFPHTLRLFVRPELPVAVLRRGAASWLVSARGRVVARLGRRGKSVLPRIWLPPRSDVSLGELLPSDDGGLAARALAAVRGTELASLIRTVSTVRGQVDLDLRSGVHVQLGPPRDVQLKLAILRQVLPQLHGMRYLNLDVPERPVAASQTLKW